MPRRPRIFVPGGIYHVIQRGVARRRIFLEPTDQDRFLSLCAETVDNFELQMLAYVLMDNHVHLAVRCGDTPIGRPLQSLFHRYALYFNRKNKRTGHLFQGRYRSVLISGEAYAKQLVRYIHRNPVRAGLCSSPAEFRYSSHDGYVHGRNPDWLAEEVVLRWFASRRSVARRRLKEFVEDETAQAEPDFMRGNSREYDALGPDGYVAKAQDGAEIAHFDPVDLDRIIETVARAYDVSSADLRRPGRNRRMAEARGVIGLLYRELGAGRMTEAGAALGREQSVMSHTTDRVRRRIDSEPELAARVQKLREQLRAG